MFRQRYFCLVFRIRWQFPFDLANEDGQALFGLLRELRKDL
jgi:hypothetical protein